MVEFDLEPELAHRHRHPVTLELIVAKDGHQWIQPSWSLWHHISHETQ
jgi:hypothetical protein